MNPDIMPEQATTTAVSLGLRCYSSWIVKSIGCKKWSGPFDWIFSSRKMVRHCLTDDFSQFLNKEHYSTVPKERRFDDISGFASHDFYAAMDGVYPVFNHHDIMETVHQEYFVRCVDRFRSSLKSTDPVLALQIYDASPADLDEFRSTADVLDAYGSSTSLLSIAVGPQSSSQSLLLLQDYKGHRHYRFTPVSKWGALEFDDRQDDEAIKSLVRTRLAAKASAKSPSLAVA